VTLEIRRADGRLVRRYSSADPATPIPDAKSAPVPTYWYRPPQALSIAAGMHRFLWDMHCQPIADVAPTAHTLTAVSSALNAADAVMARWASLKSADLPALNTTLKAAVRAAEQTAAIRDRPMGSIGGVSARPPLAGSQRTHYRTP
jgi:hypothetical protein